MTSEQYQCKAELPITDTEEAEIEQIALGSYFVDINEILNREIKAEATEVKPISEYGVSNECPKNNENGKFYDSNSHSSKFEVMLRDSIEDPADSKISPAHFWENRNFNGVADELAKQKVNHFEDGLIVKNEGHPECNDDSPKSNVEQKTKAVKNEDDIDIIYEDVKPEICDEEASGLSENGSYQNSIANILIRTEIRPNFSHELSKDSETWPQQNIEEDKTDVERVSDPRKESTVTFDSQNCRTIQNLPHCKNPEFHPFGSKQDFNERLDSKIKSFQCLSCSKSFTKKNIFLRHERIHTGEKPYQCKICFKAFTEKSHVSRHERIHTGEKPYQCKICLKCFVEKSKLLVHERIHRGEKPFQCRICLISFTQKGTLTKHERLHTGERPFQCKICLKSFILETDLTKHERLHTEKRPFQCKICLLSFTQRGDLRKHEWLHTGERPFQCKICKKKFAQKSTLLDHERIHTGEKPFQCKICLISFIQKGNLTKHERLHTGERPFQCKICLISFTQKGDLTKHERFHTGERPFQCKICLKNFAQKSTLLDHGRIHPGEKLF